MSTPSLKRTILDKLVYSITTRTINLRRNMRPYMNFRMHVRLSMAFRRRMPPYINSKIVAPGQGAAWGGSGPGKEMSLVMGFALFCMGPKKLRESHQ